jgi:hypothetical protein
MIYTPPDNISKRSRSKTTIFLAGSIEMGTATEWQTEISEFLTNMGGFHIFNPRRPDWNNEIKQEYSDPSFYQQVNWELNALEQSDIILMYFDPNTKSPISLLEFGLYAKTGKLRVICPEGFWKKGNVDIVCDRYNVRMLTSLEHFKYIIQNKKTL